MKILPILAPLKLKIWLDCWFFKILPDWDTEFVLPLLDAQNITFKKKKYFCGEKMNIWLILAPLKLKIWLDSWFFKILPDWDTEFVLPLLDAQNITLKKKIYFCGEKTNIWLILDPSGLKSGSIADFSKSFLIEIQNLF